MRPKTMLDDEEIFALKKPEEKPYSPVKNAKNPEISKWKKLIPLWICYIFKAFLSYPLNFQAFILNPLARNFLKIAFQENIYISKNNDH